MGGNRKHGNRKHSSRKHVEVIETIHLRDRRLKPRIIGKWGAVIQGIEKDTGCCLKLEDNLTAGSGSFFVRISGPDRVTVGKAVDVVHKLVEQVEDEWKQPPMRRPHGGGGSGGSDGGRGLGGGNDRGGGDDLNGGSGDPYRESNVNPLIAAQMQHKAVQRLQHSALNLGPLGCGEAPPQPIDEVKRTIEHIASELETRRQWEAVSGSSQTLNGSGASLPFSYKEGCGASGAGSLPSYSGKSGNKKSSSRRSLGSHSYSTVSFAYEDMEASRHRGREELVHTSCMDSIHVVLPASAGRAEVVLDCRGSQGSPMTSWPVESCARTWGLGYVQDEIPSLNMEHASEEISAEEQVGNALEEWLAEERVGYVIEARSGEEQVVCAIEEGPTEEPVGCAIEEVGAEKHTGHGVDKWPAEECVGYAVEGKIAEEHVGYAVDERPAEEHVGYAIGSIPQTSRQACNPGSSLGASKVRFSGRADIVPKQQTARKSAVNNGYLSIGGLKIFTSDMLALSSGEDHDARVVQQSFMDGDGEDEDEEDGPEDWLMEFHQRKKKGRQSRKARNQQAFNPYGVRHSNVDSSEGDESSAQFDSDISDELVDDYLENCEGPSADLDDPAWVRRNANSLQQVPIEDMLLQEMDSRSSELSSVEDLDKEEDGSSNCSGDGYPEHYYMVSAGDFGQRLTMKQCKNLLSGNDSDIEEEDLAEKLFSRYSSNTSCSDDGKQQDLPSSGGEDGMRDLELEKSGICVLEVKGNSGHVGDVKLRNDKQKQQIWVSKERFRLGKTEIGAGSTSANCSEDVCDAVSIATQTWPVSRGGRITKKVKGLPGQKKLERKETIATKRRERALQRGFDLSAVNKVLEDMVIKKKDIVAFEPMKQQDRAQVQRVASIYGLKSGSQGSTKQRFVVVSCTRNTGMPSGDDKVRLLKLLGQSVRDPRKAKTSNIQRTLTGDECRMFAKTKRAAFQALQGLQSSSGRKSKDKPCQSSHSKALGASKCHSNNATKDSQKSSSIKRRSAQKCSDRAIVYANNPVSFTAKGIIGEENNGLSPSASGMYVAPTSQEPLDLPIRSLRVLADSTTSKNNFAIFEAHTKGFGSRMMAKMGYREGLGLGREKQGIAEPVQAVPRPKSLGLGAHT